MAEPGSQVLRTSRRELHRGDGPKGRFYHWQGESYLSVTSIIKQGHPAPALTSWAAKSVAEFVAKRWDEVEARHNTSETADFVGWLKGRPWSERDRAADLGSLVHDIAEQWALTGEAPDVAMLDPRAASRVGQFIGFMEQVNPKVVASELVVYHHPLRYAGTLDLILDFDYPPGLLLGRALVDIKTGSGVYEEAAMQLAAYRNAESALVGDEMVDMPTVDAAFVLHLLPESWRLIPVSADASSFDAFLSARGTAEWRLNTGMGGAAQAIGVPLLTGHAGQE